MAVKAEWQRSPELLESRILIQVTKFQPKLLPLKHNFLNLSYVLCLMLTIEQKNFLFFWKFLEYLVKESSITLSSKNDDPDPD